MKYTTITEINDSKPNASFLTALELTSKRYKSCIIRFVKCRCKCGNEPLVRLSYLLRGNTVSCGCKKTADTIKRNTLWVNNSSLIGRKYRSMMDRCYNRDSPAYVTYGAKGVKVCDEWKNNYQEFINWCNANGIRQGYDLDKDVLGDGFTYSPSSCCFLPQSLNRAYQPKHRHPKKAA